METKYTATGDQRIFAASGFAGRDLIVTAIPPAEEGEEQATRHLSERHDYKRTDVGHIEFPEPPVRGTVIKIVGLMEDGKVSKTKSKEVQTLQKTLQERDAQLADAQQELIVLRGGAAMEKSDAENAYENAMGHLNTIINACRTRWPEDFPEDQPAEVSLIVARIIAPGIDPPESPNKILPGDDRSSGKNATAGGTSNRS